MAATSETRYGIASELVQLVDGFCRLALLMVECVLPKEISIDVRDLILVYYAKPLKMKVSKYGKRGFEVIWICPITGDWDFVKEHILELHLNYNIMVELHLITNKMCRPTSTEKIIGRDWDDSFEWDEENDEFVVRKSNLFGDRDMEFFVRTVNSVLRELEEDRVWIIDQGVRDRFNVKSLYELATYEDPEVRSWSSWMKLKIIDYLRENNHGPFIMQQTVPTHQLLGAIQGANDNPAIDEQTECIIQ